MWGRGEKERRGKGVAKEWGIKKCRWQIMLRAENKVERRLRKKGRTIQNGGKRGIGESNEKKNRRREREEEKIT